MPDPMEPIIARAANDLGLSMTEIREARNQQWEILLEPEGAIFTCRTADGFQVRIASEGLADLRNRKLADPNDVSFEMGTAYTMAVVGVYAAAAYALHKDRRPIPEGVRA